MATAQPVVSFEGDDIIKFAWTITTANSNGAPIGPAHVNFADRTYQAVGTWGGATLQMQGSNDGTNWFMLNDPFGVDLSLTANGMFAVAEAPLYVRPALSVAGSGASIVVTLVGRRNRPGQSRG